MALLVLQARVVILEHLDHKDLKAIRVLLAKLVKQDQLAELVILAFRASLVRILLLSVNNACAHELTFVSLS